MNIIDLYSDKQTITVTNDKYIYELKFKISSYNQEPIFLNFIALDCYQINNELICYIKKSQLESILIKDETQLSVSYISYIYHSRKFPLIPSVDAIYNFEKTDVYVGITKLVESVTETNTFIAYETNVTDITNVIVDFEAFKLDFAYSGGSYKSDCFLRKYENNPLLIICWADFTSTSWLKEITKEIIFDDINAKYTFRIQPVKNEEKIYYKGGSGSFIFYMYPEIFDFRNSDSLIVEYEMRNPNSLTGISFNEIASDLSCQTVGIEIKRCTVPKSHFEGKETGYYFTKHSNHLNGKSFSYEAPPVKVILDDSTKVTISLKGLYENYVGKKGTIIIETDFNPDFDIIDTTRDIYFNVKITNEKSNNYAVYGGFWRVKGENLYIICNIGENIPSGNYSLNFIELPTFNYKIYFTTLNQQTTLKFEKYDIDIVDLYSEKQTITIEKNKDIYELKFKILSYNQEAIMFDYYIFLNCSEKNDELICYVTKNQLESILIKNETQLAVSYICNSGHSSKFPLIPLINIIYNNVKKIDIHVEITKLIQNITEMNSLIAYETNINGINNVITNENAISLDFMNDYNEIKQYNCSFRKYDNSSLLLLCLINEEGIYHLKTIPEEIIYDDINIKYNFRIQPVSNEEKINCIASKKGTFIYSFYPEVLDFSNSDMLFVEYITENPDYLTGITFNENEEDLSCQTIGKKVKRCSVPKSHFKGKKTGYYYTKHDNHLNSKSIYYEIPPVKVIFDESPSPTDSSKGNIISFSLYFWLLLIIIF